MDMFNVSMVGLEQDAEEELWRNREKEELDTENMSNIVDKTSTTLAIQLLSTKYGFDAREACMYIVSCNVKKVIKKRVMKKKVIDVPVVVETPAIDVPVVVSDKKEKVVKEKKEKVVKAPKEKKEKVVKEKVVKEKVVKEKVVKEKVVKEKVVKAPKEKVEKPPKEKKEKPVKEKKEKVVPIIEPSVAKVVEVVSEVSEEEDDEEGQMYMAFIEKQKYWTPDEYFQNGPIHKSIINDEGDSAPGELLGQFVNGQAVFNESKQ